MCLRRFLQQESFVGGIQWNFRETKLDFIINWEKSTQDLAKKPVVLIQKFGKLFQL